MLHYKIAVAPLGCCVLNDSKGKLQGDKQGRGGSLSKEYATTAAGLQDK